MLSQRIALTGGTGFLGRHLLAHLQDQEVRCLVRPASRRRSLPENARKIEGDCITGTGLADLMRGQDVLIHMASVLFGQNWQSYLSANSRACQNIVAALAALPASEQPERIIFVSSLAAAGPCAASPGLAEDCIPRPVSAYGWSKLLGEKIFQAALGSRLVTIRPPIIYGSGDRGLLPMFRSARLGIGISPGWRRSFPVSIIHADDAARALILCCRKQASGIYHLSDGREYTMAAFCRGMGQALGKSDLRILRPPLPLMGLSAAASSGLANLARLWTAQNSISAAPQWNLDKYREARQPGWLANAAKMEQLGFKPKMDLDTGMREAVDGYKSLGWL